MRMETTRRRPPPPPPTMVPKSIRMRQEQEKVYTSWDDVPLVLTLREAAKLLGVLPETLRRKAVKGELPAFKVSTKSEWKINKRDLMALCGVKEAVSG